VTSYAALLRGILPTNPNMRNEKLRSVFERLGFKNVHTIISSGNVIFESNHKNIPLLEAKIEKELMKRLGIKCPVYIRSKKELEALVRKNPFKGAEHGTKSYLIVTFRRLKPREIFNSLDMTNPNTPKFMQNIEKKFGKDVTTRTWKTVGRILEKMEVIYK
jgi:uncharacterized protein (DUF1697 family)